MADVTIRVAGEAVTCTPDTVTPLPRETVTWRFDEAAKWSVILPSETPASRLVLGSLSQTDNTTIDSKANPGDRFKYAVVVQRGRKVLSADPDLVIGP